jgi:hypothetical protein
MPNRNASLLFFSNRMVMIRFSLYGPLIG